VAAARVYLRRSNFARYCDQILLPGLALAATDFRAGRIGGEQQDRIRLTIATVAQSLRAVKPHEGASRRRRSTSLLDANVGAHLHEVRGQRLGRWQGATAVPAGAAVLCVSLGSVREDLLSQLLLQALRDEGVQARIPAPAASPETPESQRTSGVSTVFLAYPLKEHHAAWQAAVRDLRISQPQAMLLTIKLPLEDAVADDAAVAGQVDLVVRSFSEAVAFVLAGRAVLA
ncbi:MAG: transporter, partial [Ramlibacter sp.]|nr:transporter [Ramlibacter sp.]